MSSQTLSGKSNFNVDPNHIYYDLQLLNNDTTGNSASLPIKFQETRLAPILANPSEYFLSIQRFSLDTVSLPLVLPQVDTNESTNPDGDPDKLVYQWGYQDSDDHNVSYFNVIYAQQDFTLLKPEPNQVLFDPSIISNPYYFVYTFQNFVDMINNSFITNCPTGYAPQLVLNQTTNAYDLWFPSGSTPAPPTASFDPYWMPKKNLTTNPDTLRLFFNAPLFTLFSSLNSIYVGILTNPRSPEIIVPGNWYNVSPSNATIDTPDGAAYGNYDFLGLNTAPKPPLIDTAIWPPTVENHNPISFFQINSAQYPTQPLWNPVKQILFTTSMMPIVNELVGIPIIQNSNPNLNNTQPNNNFSPIITDLEVSLTRGDETKPNITYIPTAEYRLIDLQSNAPINQIEIALFWKDQYGTVHPFLLEPGCGASIKMLFRRKVFNLVSLKEYTKPV